MKEISVHWCPTKEMVADFWTKSLQGSHFRKLHDYIMGRVCSVKPKCDAGSITKTVRTVRKKVLRVVQKRKVKVGIKVGHHGCIFLQESAGIL